MASNVRIESIESLETPEEVIAAMGGHDSSVIEEARRTISEILHGRDSRQLIVVGPCSVHDVQQALDYGRRLQLLRPRFSHLYLVQRVYFEKPRTTVGWKGLIYDPDLDDSSNIRRGIRLARQTLLELTRMGIPCACEFLDLVTPQYLADLVSWGAIGARTSESQLHRQLASGLSMPVGFKNLTNGSFTQAVDGVISARMPHQFLSVTDSGVVASVKSKGNQDCHTILRGGSTPNYSEAHIAQYSAMLEARGIDTGIVVDCSHSNCDKVWQRQVLVAIYTRRLQLSGKYPIRGLMMESHINAGCQKLVAGKEKELKYGVSITDPCMDLETTELLLTVLEAMEEREFTTLDELREAIQRADRDILLLVKDSVAAAVPPKIVVAKSHLHVELDKELAEMCLPYGDKAPTLMMMIALRMSISEGVASVKMRNNTGQFLLRQNGILEMVTHLSVERKILSEAGQELSSVKLDHTGSPNLPPLYLRILEKSKAVQVAYITAMLEKTRIGYLFGPGTMSFQCVEKFRGQHISFSSVAAIYEALANGSIDYGLIPTHNSHIGAIYTLPEEAVRVVTEISHPVILSCYANVPSLKQVELVICEPHMYAEAYKFVESHLRHIEFRKSASSVDAILETRKSSVPTATIAGTAGSSLLHLVAENVVQDNFTVFHLVEKK